MSTIRAMPPIRFPQPRRAVRALIVALGCVAPTALWAQAATGQTAIVQTDQVRAELVVHAPQGIAAGRPAWLGLRLRHAAHWHSYWKNPGDSGMATSLRWTLPAGVSASEIEWPTPRRLPVGPLINYGYEGDVLLPVALSVPAHLGTATLDVKLHAQWLVCKDQCIPQSGEFALSIASGAAVPAHVAHAAAFANARASLPRAPDGVQAQSRVDGAALALEASGLPASWPGRAIEFFAEDGGVIEHAAAVEQRWEGARLFLRVPLSAQRSESPDPMRAVLVARGDAAGQALRFGVQGGWPALGAAPAAPVAAPAARPNRVRAEDSSPWSASVLGIAALSVVLALGLVWLLRRSRRAGP
jgi:DsbC/DsbD-like thiol-disulfide interchange protein